MRKTLKTFLLLFLFFALAAGGGYYFGLREREIRVMVREEGATTTPQEITIRGEELLRGEAELEAAASKVPWYVSRASAIAAYILMFLVIVWGMGMTTGFTYRVTNPVMAWSVHKYMSVSLGVLVLVHMFSLLFDDFIGFGFAEILVPYAADFKPFYLALGIVGFYILGAVMFTSLVIRERMPRFWHGVHYLVYPLFVMSLAHGLFLGTDSSTLAMQAVYWVTGTVFTLLLIYRFFIYKAEADERSPEERARKPLGSVHNKKPLR